MASLTRLGALFSFLTIASAQSIMIGLPPSARVASMNFFGSGCEDGTRASAEVDAQNKIHLSTNYMESHKTSTRSTETETLRTCTFDIKFRYNPGQQFAIQTHETNGVAMLKTGMSASLQTSVQYQSLGYDVGTQTFVKSWNNLQFDRSESYTEREDQDMGMTQNIPWSSCSGEETMRIVLTTTMDGNPGRTDCRDCQMPSLTSDNTLFSMMWKSCNSNQGNYGGVAPQPQQSQSQPGFGCNDAGCGSNGLGMGPGQINPFSGALNPPIPDPAPYQSPDYRTIGPNTDLQGMTSWPTLSTYSPTQTWQNGPSQSPDYRTIPTNTISDGIIPWPPTSTYSPTQTWQSVPYQSPDYRTIPTNTISDGIIPWPPTSTYSPTQTWQSVPYQSPNYATISTNTISDGIIHWPTLYRPGRRTRKV